jgi:outer membrane receptor protein involved in Fe transport
VIGRRNVEGGPRQEDLRHTDYRGVVGLRGDIGENWRYDLYGQYGTVLFQSLFLNDISRSRARRALDVVADANGVPVCRSATGAGAIDPACVPYDIFSIAGPSQAAVAYLSTPGLQQGNTRETVVSGTVSGDLTDYGLRSPLAETGVGVAIGTEYRRESLELIPDISYQTDDLTGQGGATLPVRGSYELYELFGEARVPLAQDRPFFRELSMELGYRFSAYSLGFDTSTYKVGGEWRPIEDIRLRASLNRAVRAPNIVELFSAQSVGLNGTTDPCAGAAPRFTAAQCANTGVTAAQYGRVVENTAAQYNGLTGGNPDLEPETSDTVSFGLSFTPTFLRGLSVVVDYYKITVRTGSARSART